MKLKLSDLLLFGTFLVALLTFIFSFVPKLMH